MKHLQTSIKWGQFINSVMQEELQAGTVRPNGMHGKFEFTKVSVVKMSAKITVSKGPT